MRGEREGQGDGGRGDIVGSLLLRGGERNKASKVSILSSVSLSVQRAVSGSTCLGIERGDITMGRDAASSLSGRGGGGGGGGGERYELLLVFTRLAGKRESLCLDLLHDLVISCFLS